MATIGIPQDVADITPTWLTEVFRQDEGGSAVTVTEVVAEQIGVGIGIMGESWRLTLRYERPGPGWPATVVVKLPSPFPENRAHGVNLGLYDSETRFYRHMAATTATPTPTCYLSLKDPDDAAFVIVMEDLSGLHMVDQREGLSGQGAERAVVALAELHASWWGRVVTAEHEWIPSLLHPRIEAMAALWPQLWPVFVERFGRCLPEGGLPLGEMVRDRYWPLMQQLADCTWTLLHMDFRCENLLFGEPGSPREVVVLDWQSLGRGSGVYDLAYLLGGSMTTEDRRVHEGHLVHRYHEVLRQMEVGGYSYDQLWADYRLAHLVAGTATCVLTGASTDLGNERGVQLIETMTARHFAAAVDLAGAELAR